MKKIKKIGTILVVVAMMCAMSISVSAAELLDHTVGTTVAGAEINIDKATVQSKDGLITVTLSYSFKNGVNPVDDTQITMIGYVFEKDGSLATSVEASDTVADLANTPVNGSIRAIDQDKHSVKGGTITFNLATTGDGYTVSDDAILAVKIGNNVAETTTAQAFFVQLGNIKYDVTCKPGTYGESNTAVSGEVKTITDGVVEGVCTMPECEYEAPVVGDDEYRFAGWKIEGDTTNKVYKAGEKVEGITGPITLVAQWSKGTPGDADGNGEVDGLDALAIRQYAFNNTPLAREDLADVNADGVPDGLDALAIRQYVFNNTPFSGSN